MTVSELMWEFYNSYCLKRLAKNTCRGYYFNIKNHIVPTLGHINIKELNCRDLDKCFEVMHTEKGLSKTTARYALAVLRRAIKYAIKREYINRNIFELYDMPKPDRVEYTFIYTDGACQLLNFLYFHDKDIFLPVYFMLRHGLRRGEALGIKRSDINANYLHIRRSALYDGSKLEISDCKTPQSKRPILLDEADLSIINAYNHSRPANPEGYLSRRSDGSLISYNVLQKHFKKALKALNFDDMRIHDLRHSFATIMLEKEVSPLIVSQILGHSDVKTTLSIYTHANTKIQAVANKNTQDMVRGLV